MSTRNFHSNIEPKGTMPRTKASILHHATNTEMTRNDYIFDGILKWVDRVAEFVFFYFDLEWPGNLICFLVIFVCFLPVNVRDNNIEKTIGMQQQITAYLSY